ncbi:MAG: TldD/PmbA family protein, partial [Clostridiales bacterium]
AIGDMIKRVNEYAWQLNPLIKQVTIGYGDSQKEMLLANVKGRFVHRNSGRKRFFVKIVVKRNSDIETAMATLGDTQTSFLWTEKLLMEKVDKAVENAINLLDAKDAPSGPMNVILSGTAGGTMVHEACGHGLEADHIEKGLSVYKDKLGQMVASPKITVIDDATIPNKYGSYEVDDEGEVGRKNILIRNGILEQYMFDIRTAQKMGKKSTGNGRRESYRFSPQVRMSNTYIAPGNDEPQAILADTKKGLFVKTMGGGQVNTNNGDFVFEVSEGYLIENGALTYPVKNATLIGNGPKTLGSVFALGSDLGFAIGTCGKGGQSVPVGDAQPTLGLSEVVVGGTQ